MKYSFSAYLKDLRKKSELTQSEAMQKLILQDEDFEHLDIVTFSRWERNVTKPNRSRQISVLRVFTNDLLDYLNSSFEDSEMEFISRLEFIESRIFKRYFNPFLIMSSRSYYDLNPCEDENVIVEVLNDNNYEDFKFNLSSFFNCLKGMNFDYGIDDVEDLFIYTNDHRIIFNRFLVNNTIYGHTIKAIFDKKVFDKELRCLTVNHDANKKDINLALTTPYSRSNKLVCYMFSQYAASEKVFRKQLREECAYLATHANIHYFYKKISLKTSLELMLKMGFEFVAHGPLNASGEIKIGTKNFTWAILGIATNRLLARPEFAYFLVK